MADEQIETRRFFKKIRIELFNNRLIVKKSSPFETSEYELSYEQIENKKAIATNVNFGLLVVTSLTAIIGFPFLFGDKIEIAIALFIFSILSLLLAFATK